MNRDWQQLPPALLFTFFVHPHRTNWVQLSRPANGLPPPSTARLRVSSKRVCLGELSVFQRKTGSTRVNRNAGDCPSRCSCVIGLSLPRLTSIPQLSENSLVRIVQLGIRAGPQWFGSDPSFRSTNSLTLWLTATRELTPGRLFLFVGIIRWCTTTADLPPFVSIPVPETHP
jgi:hypothetical protein